MKKWSPILSSSIARIDSAIAVLNRRLWTIPNRMPDLTSTRDQSPVGRDRAEEFLTVLHSISAVQDMSMTSRGLVAAHEHGPGSDRAFRAVRVLIAPARKAYGSSLTGMIIDAEVHQVPGTVRASNGRRTFPPTRKLVPAACVPENAPSGIHGSNLNEVTQ